MNNTYDDTKDNNNNEEEGVSDGKLVSLETTPLNSTSFPSFSGVTNKKPLIMIVSIVQFTCVEEAYQS